MVFLLVSFFVSCSNGKDEELFKNKVMGLMKDSDIIETDFIKFTNFKWDEIYFGREPYVSMVFINFQTKEKKNINLEGDKFVMDENYVDGSPAGKCFLRNQKFILKIDYQYKNYVRIILKEEKRR